MVWQELQVEVAEAGEGNLGSDFVEGAGQLQEDPLMAAHRKAAWFKKQR